MNFLKSVANKLGVDKAIAYSSGARIVQVFTGVGSIFFISSFLTGVEQGFYYTFGSILAIQVFFELGLTGIMTQYVAHESSHLTLDENCYTNRIKSVVKIQRNAEKGDNLEQYKKLIHIYSMIYFVSFCIIF